MQFLGRAGLPRDAIGGSDAAALLALELVHIVHMSQYQQLNFGDVSLNTSIEAPSKQLH
jgi:hypothetical protein